MYVNHHCLGLWPFYALQVTHNNFTLADATTQEAIKMYVFYSAT